MWQNAWLYAFPKDTWQWHETWPLLIWTLLLIYTSFAAWVDLRERRIPNSWTVLWLVMFAWIHFENRTLMSAVLGFIIVTLSMLVPTILGVWGQGDWKMAMVIGTAVGAFPTLFIWFIGFLIVPLLKPWMYRLSLRYLSHEAARSIPVAVPVFSAISTLFVSFLLLSTM